jgi:hypothetical protein
MIFFEKRIVRIKKMKKMMLSLTGTLLLAGVGVGSMLNAANLTASGSTAGVYWQDSDVGTNQWLMWGDDNALGIHQVGETGNLFYAHKTSAKNDNSIRFEADGNLTLGNGSVKIDRATGRVGIGTDKPESTLTLANDNAVMKFEGDMNVDFGADDGSLDWFLHERVDVNGANDGKGFSISYNFNTTGIINKVPFTILGNADDNSLFINDSGVGILNSNPSAALDVTGDIRSTWSGSNTVDDGLTNLLLLSANNSAAGKESDAGFALVNAREGKQWNFRTHQNGNAFIATIYGTGGPEFTVKNATANVKGTELYLGNGAKNVGGVWINASSRALKENIEDLSAQDALAAFEKLQPVTYNYKSDKKEQVVGFIAEDVPELVAINSRDGLSSMDIVAVLTKVVQEQEKKIAALEAQQIELKVLKDRMATLELILTNVAHTEKLKKREAISLK